MAAPAVDPRHVKYDTAASGGVVAYVFIQFVLALAGATLLLFRQDDLSLGVRAAGALAIVVTLVALGGLLERKRWARWLEPARVIGLVAVGLMAAS